MVTESSDNRIAAEIEALRDKFPKTRELYREVCALLFFRYGITPTANRLYQYVRKGSMGTPAQVLSEFWNELRERSRVRLDYPEMPEHLRQTGGELLMQLWGIAQREAHDGVSSLAQDAENAVINATRRLRESETKMDELTADLARTREQLTQSQAAKAELAIELAVIQGRLASMTEMLRDQSEELEQQRVSTQAAQHDVARALGEANALRVQLAIAKTRATRKPLGGVPLEPDPGQESLALEPVQPEPEQGKTRLKKQRAFGAKSHQEAANSRRRGTPSKA